MDNKVDSPDLLQLLNANVDAPDLRILLNHFVAQLEIKERRLKEEYNLITATLKDLRSRQAG
jgi:predicted TIM-barrel fold metal-dependent hydrolase